MFYLQQGKHSAGRSGNKETKKKGDEKEDEETESL